MTSNKAVFPPLCVSNHLIMSCEVDFTGYSDILTEIQNHIKSICSAHMVQMTQGISTSVYHYIEVEGSCVQILHKVQSLYYDHVVHKRSHVSMYCL